MHSRFDPWAEANDFVQSEGVQFVRRQGFRPAVFGLGLGYHVLTLARLFTDILVIEPDPAMIRLAFQCLDFTGNMSGLRFLTERPPVTEWPPTILVPHAPSVRLYHEDYRYWAGVLPVMIRDRRRKAAVVSADRLVRDCRAVPGVSELASGLPEHAWLDQAELTAHVRAGRGVLTDAEIYTLLLQELTRPANPGFGRSPGELGEK